MKMSTAEIKLLLKECVQDGDLHTTSDFCEYIVQRSDKTFTKGQISGAIAQLSDTGDIIKVERGLYQTNARKKDSSLPGKFSNKKSWFVQETINFLNGIETEFADFVNSKKVWQLNEYEFGILSEMRELKERMERIRNYCN